MSDLVLVVDDDPIICEHLARVLDRSGFLTATAADGVEALEVIAARRPALIVLDVLMPRADGREVLARLRRDGDWTPVILLTGVGQSGTRADALEKGADDYLNKPFDPAELVARIRAVLRRGQVGRTLSHAARIAGGDLELDRLAKSVTAKGRPVQLTPKALALLEYLMIHHGETFSRDHLLEQVWGVEFAITTRAVDHRVAELRKVLGAWGLDVIDTVQGVGYRFHPRVTIS